MAASPKNVHSVLINVQREPQNQLHRHVASAVLKGVGRHEEAELILSSSYVEIVREPHPWGDRLRPSEASYRVTADLNRALDDLRGEPPVNYNIRVDAAGLFDVLARHDEAQLLLSGRLIVLAASPSGEIITASNAIVDLRQLLHEGNGVAYWQLAQWLAHRDRRRIAANLYAVRESNGHGIHVRHRNTNVVTVYPNNTYTLRTEKRDTPVIWRTIAWITGMPRNIRIGNHEFREGMNIPGVSDNAGSASN